MDATNTPRYPVVLFPEGYEERLEDEAPERGYLSHVIVATPDGLRYRLFFIDLTRLSQDLPRDVGSGRAYFAEPGLIVVPEVTRAAIEHAVRGLWEELFFEDLQPLS